MSWGNYYNKMIPVTRENVFLEANFKWTLLLS